MDWKIITCGNREKREVVVVVLAPGSAQCPSTHMRVEDINKSTCDMIRSVTGQVT